MSQAEFVECRFLLRFRRQAADEFLPHNLEGNEDEFSYRLLQGFRDGDSR